MTASKDWFVPGVEQAAEGVYRITLPLPNDSLRAVNVYALVADDGVTLIDAGWAIQEAQDELERSLAELGSGLGDVRRILVTHVHRDHFTLALVLRRLCGAEISLGVGEQDSVKQLCTGLDGGPFRLLGRWGAGDVAERLASAPGHDPVPELYDPPDHWIDGPATLRVAGRELLAVPTPGHTNGHLVFADLQAGILFAGDHVLPRITPSIGYEPARPDQPLQAYLRSLQRVIDLPDLRLLPAHGPVMPSTHERARELVDHHEERLRATQAAVGSSPRTVREVAAGLGWTRRDRRLDELDPLNQALAVSETAAHLDLLVLRGSLEVRSTAGADLYADPAALVGP